jgi:hypothetical protein
VKQISIRYPASKMEPRIEALLPLLQADHPAVPLSASKAMLMALLEGLDVLERRYGLATE